MAMVEADKYFSWMKNETTREPVVEPGDQALTDRVFENPDVKARIEEYLANRSAYESQPVTSEELWADVLERVRQEAAE